MEKNLIEIICNRKKITESQAEADIRGMREKSRNDFHYQMMLRTYLEDETHPFGTGQHHPIEPHLRIKE